MCLRAASVLLCGTVSSLVLRPRAGEESGQGPGGVQERSVDSAIEFYIAGLFEIFGFNCTA